MRGDVEWGTIPELVRSAAERYATTEAVVEGRTRITYAELGARIDRTAAACLAGGVDPGDRVAVWAPTPWTGWSPRSGRSRRAPFGLSEAGGIVTMCRRGDDAAVIASTSGRVVPGTEVRVAGPDGEPLPAGTPGEVLVRGYHMMRGYFEDEAATALAITPDGWLRTGDVGVLDGDATSIRPRAGPRGAVLRADLPALPEAVVELRYAVRRRLGEPSPGIEPCVTEPLGNVVRHGGQGTPARVRRGRAGDHLLRVEVTDPCPRALPVLPHATAEDESGRGLALLDAVALRRGAEPGPAGWTVWCEVACPERRPHP